MKNCMLTVHLRTTDSARDVQVNGAPDLRAAIEHAERLLSPYVVDHGQGQVGRDFRPAIILDYGTDRIYREHDDTADASMKVIQPQPGWAD